MPRPSGKWSVITASVGCLCTAWNAAGVPHFGARPIVANTGASISVNSCAWWAMTQGLIEDRRSKLGTFSRTCLSDQYPHLSIRPLRNGIAPKSRYSRHALPQDCSCSRYGRGAARLRLNTGAGLKRFAAGFEHPGGAAAVSFAPLSQNDSFPMALYTFSPTGTRPCRHERSLVHIYPTMVELLTYFQTTQLTDLRMYQICLS